MANVILTICAHCLDGIVLYFPNGEVPDPDEVVLCGQCRADQYRYWEDEAGTWAEIDDAEARDDEMCRADLRDHRDDRLNRGNSE